MKIEYGGVIIEGEGNEVLAAFSRILDKYPPQPNEQNTCDKDSYEKIPYWMRPDFKAPEATCGTNSTGDSPRNDIKITC